MDLLRLVARLLLAAVFAVAGTTKLRDRSGFQGTLQEFGLPSAWSSIASIAIPAAEIFVAIALLVPRTAWWGALGALVLLVLFSSAIAYNLIRGRNPHCHCFGQLHSRPVAWRTLVRNAGIAMLTAPLISGGADRFGGSALGWLHGLSGAETALLVLAIVGCAAIGGLVWFVDRLFAQHGRVLVRLEAVELQLANLSAGRRPAEPQQPPAGLMVGAPAPTFTARRLSGEDVSLPQLLRTGKPALLLFVDPNCGPCASLLPLVVKWRRALADAVTIAIMSRGTAAENRRKFGGGDLPPVLLQNGNSVSEQYFAGATPSALLVRPDGRIGSHVAAGPDAIKALIATLTEATHPATTDRGVLPAAAPEVRLQDLDGRWVTLADFRGTEALVLFWNPGCSFCQQMLPELRAWEQTRSDRAPQLLVISTGTKDENRAMGLASPIVLDDGFNAGRSFGAGGTPSAVLIDRDGRIGSAMAVGARAVLTLAAPVECAT